MNGCEEFQDLLDPFVDGELAPEELLRVREHLDACPACRSYVDDALAIRAAFPSVEETEVPEGFTEGVMERIHAAAPKKTVSVSFRRRWMGAAAALAACCAIVVLLKTGPVGMGGGMDAGAAVMMEEAESGAGQEDAPAECAGQTAEAAAEDCAGPSGEVGADETPAFEEDGEMQYTSGAAPENESKDAAKDSARSAPASAPQTRSAPTGNEGALPEDFADVPAVMGGVGPTDDGALSPEEEEDAAPLPEAGNAPTALEKPEAPAAVMAPVPSFAQTEGPDLVLTQEEAGDLLDGFAPAEDNGTERTYLLTREEFAGLIEKLSLEYVWTDEKELITVLVKAA